MSFETFDPNFIFQFKATELSSESNFASSEVAGCTWDRLNRVRPRFFNQVGHETMDASSGNKHFFTKSCHHQTYQNYEQSRQKLGTILENKVS